MCGNFEVNCPMHYTNLKESVLSTRMSSEFVYEFSENKGQFARIRDKNVKFRSVYVDCPNSILYSMF